MTIAQQLEQKGIEKGILLGREEGMQEGILLGTQKGMLLGKQEGRLEGKQEGKLEGKLEIARALLATGMSEEAVQHVTGLSAQDLEQIKH